MMAELAELFNIFQKEVVRLIKSNPIFIVAIIQLNWLV